MRQKRLLLVMTHLGNGGAQRVVSTLLRHFPRNGEELHLCLLTGEGPFLASIPADVRIYRMHASRALYSLFPLWRLMRRLKPDVVFSSLWVTDVVVWLARGLSGLRPRLVFRCCTFPASGLAIQPIHMRFLIPLAYRRADTVIATTRSMEADLAESFKVAASRIRKIENPLDLSQISSSSQGTVEAGSPYLSAMGRLIYDKGYDVLIRAFAMLRDTTVRLLILGTGPKENELRQLAKQLGVEGRVEFPGFLADPWPVLRRSRMFLLTSRREGFPNALVEAMALGIPCIATKCDSGPEEILRNEANGLLVEVDDEDGLAKAMARLLEDPQLAGRIGNQARKDAEKYGSGPIAAEFLKILRGDLA